MYYNMNENINKVIDGLYIGNYKAALSKEIINKYNIGSIVNCTKRNDRFDNKDDIYEMRYLQIPITDPPNAEDIEYLNKNYKNINYWIDLTIEHTNILIHCEMGSQRSAAVVAIYLMHKFNNLENTYKKINCIDVCNYLKKIRPICFFGNINYIKSLEFVQQEIDKSGEQINN